MYNTNSNKNCGTLATPYTVLGRLLKDEIFLVGSHNSASKN